MSLSCPSLHQELLKFLQEREEQLTYWEMFSSHLNVFHQYKLIPDSIHDDFDEEHAIIRASPDGNGGAGVFDTVIVPVSHRAEATGLKGKPTTYLYC